MTVLDGLTDEFSTMKSSSGTANWLPFSAKKREAVTKCDVSGYFVVEESDLNTRTATFRGRALKGLKVDTNGFEIIVPTTNASEDQSTSTKVKELIVWNHDDMPLQSDVVPQAIALARLQQALGST